MGDGGESALAPTRHVCGGQKSNLKLCFLLARGIELSFSGHSEPLPIKLPYCLRCLHHDSRGHWSHCLIHGAYGERG